MDHQLFETWLLSPDPLEVDQEAALQAHLRGCPACRMRLAGWRAVERSLQDAGLVGPSPGFVGRWETRLAEMQQQRARHQSWLVLAAITLAVLALGSALSAHLLAVYNSPAQLVVGLLAGVTELVSTFNAYVEVLEAVSRTLPAVFILVTWLGVVALGGMSILWLLSIHRLTFQRRVNP